MRFHQWTLAVVAVVCLSPASGRAQSSAIPQLDSRPGAAYTLYLDFGGFSFTGNWNNNSADTPGVTLETSETTEQ